MVQERAAGSGQYSRQCRWRRMVVVRATVIKIARAIIILKPAFLAAPPPPGRWTAGGGVASAGR